MTSVTLYGLKLSLSSYVAFSIVDFVLLLLCDRVLFSRSSFADSDTGEGTSTLGTAKRPLVDAFRDWMFESNNDKTLWQLPTVYQRVFIDVRRSRQACMSLNAVSTGAWMKLEA